MLMYTVKRPADKISKECILVKLFKRSEGNLCSSFGNLTDLVQLIGLWSPILKSETSVVTTALGLFV